MKELNNSFANEKLPLIRRLQGFSFAGSFAEMTTLQNNINRLCNLFRLQTKHLLNADSKLLQTKKP